MVNAENWIIKNIGHEVINLSLEHLTTLTLPFAQYFKKINTKIVIVGGTNGKGQTCQILAKLLSENGISFTLFTSPHITSIRERFVSNTGPIEDLLLLNLFKENKKFVKQLSYFEFLFINFLQYSMYLKPQVIILEVGLGGRLDAANSMSPDLSLITSISRDHEEILGRGYKRILLEKLPISRKNTMLLTAFELDYLSDIAKEYCINHQIPWVDLFQLRWVDKSDSFIKRNYKMAVSAFNWLVGQNLAPNDLEISSLELGKFNFLGRGNHLQIKNGNFVFFGSHNLDGVRKLISYIESQNVPPFDDVLISFSKRNESEIRWMLKIFYENKKLFKNVLVTTFDHPKAFKWSEENIELINWKNFLKNDFHGKKILVTGSYYFVGEVLRYLKSF